MSEDDVATSHLSYTSDAVDGIVLTTDRTQALSSCHELQCKVISEADSIDICKKPPLGLMFYSKNKSINQ